MSYCINCSLTLGVFIAVILTTMNFVKNCGTNLTINERYRIVKPLRELNRHHHTEIFEIDNLGTTKVLKVLTSDRRRLVELFKQEVAILKQLNHLGVPFVDTCFTFSLPDNQKQLYCLVMEKIPGQNLAQWLAENKQLSEELAIDWLWQLSEFLKCLHLKEVIHRDIKPSNIMLHPDGKLIVNGLWHSKKYYRNLRRANYQKVILPEFTLQDILHQNNYKVKRYNQSDYFALGRTFIHLLTGHTSRQSTPKQRNWSINLAG